MRPLRAPRITSLALALALAPLAACSPEAEGLAPAQPSRTTVKLDFFHKPLPEIPLPNDLATRFDASSPTRRRVNASMIAPTALETRARTLIDGLDGWGPFQPITIPFTGELDVGSIVDAHRDPHFDFSDDVVLLIDVDPASPDHGKAIPLDVGNGNYPVVLEDERYWKNDPRSGAISLTFEETNEDLDGDGALGPGEDTDGDGALDVPNYLPGRLPAADDLAGRADALMTFYERQTHTLIVRPMEPLRERTTYAVVITRRLRDAGGQPVGSPYPWVNHSAQTEALEPLRDHLPAGTRLSDVAFAFSFTTQSVASEWIAVREGLYGHGAQAHLGQDFPGEIGEVLPMRDEDKYPDTRLRHLMYAEQWAETFPTLATGFLGMDETSESLRVNLEAFQYIDWITVASFDSPQLFERYDANGALLPYDEQVWPADLARRPADARRERVLVTVVAPRKEVSARGQGRPAPVAIIGHGYGSSRFDALQFAGFLARHGVASVAIDCASHGLVLDDLQRALARSLFATNGLQHGVDALLEGRALDQNGDGLADSGADFWSAYLFHTRDVVRQSMLDYTQLVRVLRGFDGQRRWSLDVNGDGQQELAGDFDADGVVDLGGDVDYFMLGGSLGGIMSMVMSAVEPALVAAVPVAGGGGLSDVGIRSKQGGVPEAFILRGMGPLYVLTVTAGTGTLETIVPDLNSARELPIGTVEGVAAGDTLVAVNLRNGERACAPVSAAGTARVGLPSDVGDPTRLELHRGEVTLPGTECALRPGAPAPYAVVDRFAQLVEYQGRQTPEGSPLVALAEGLGLRRVHPDLRRFQGIGQLVLDAADPAVFARHIAREPITYPYTGETTGTHVLAVTSMGDMNVPASSGVTFGRAAGMIPYLTDDPRLGKPANQALLDLYVAEAVHTFERHVDTAGNGVHLDVENFSQGRDPWGDTIPRLEDPLHLGFETDDLLGGRSASIFPYTVPEGAHGFDLPGQMVDRAREMCLAGCAETGVPDPCGCVAAPSFDFGLFMFNLFGRYMRSGGTFLTADPCMATASCPAPWDWPAPPAARDAASLP
ncbi:MAG: hypothetical protein IT376_16205 [Polyangiaceae bacterium]|nr:hypothetical protein [Polyangiaceae bacterium]